MLSIWSGPKLCHVGMGFKDLSGELYQASLHIIMHP